MKCFLYFLLIYLLNTNASKQTDWSVGKKTHTVHTIQHDYRIQEEEKNIKHNLTYKVNKQIHNNVIT